MFIAILFVPQQQGIVDWDRAPCSWTSQRLCPFGPASRQLEGQVMPGCPQNDFRILSVKYDAGQSLCWASSRMFMECWLWKRRHNWEATQLGRISEHQYQFSTGKPFMSESDQLGPRLLNKDMYRSLPDMIRYYLLESLRVFFKLLKPPTTY